MGNKEKCQIISNIIAALKFEARQKNKRFDEGDTFFALCFKEDKELIKIAKLSGTYQQPPRQQAAT